MTEDDEGFLSRWARRKQSSRRDAELPAEPRETPRPAGPEDEAGAEVEGERHRQEVIDNLPDPDTLSEQDDFTQFMQQGVPEDLRHRALRRLWRSNPIYAVRDGLNDYDLDYTDAATIVENLKTVFQVGRGVVTEEDRAAEAAEPEDAEDAPSGSTDVAAEPEAAPEAVAAEEDPESSPDRIPARRFSAARSGDVEPQDALAVERGSVKSRVSGSVKSRVKGNAARRRWGGADA